VKAAPLPIDVVLLAVDPRHASAEVHTAARVVIGSRLALYPSVVEIGREPSGRPVVEGVALSLGHSGALGVIAVADPGHAIGVDVEVVRPRLHVERMAQRMFLPHELPGWTALDEDARLHAFLQRWTEVEAVLKARGTGVAGGFAAAVPVPDGWACAPIDAGPGFVGAVAADTPEIVVHIRRLRR